MTQMINSATSVAPNRFRKEGITNNNNKMKLDHIIRGLQNGCQSPKDWELLLAFHEHYAPKIETIIRGDFEARAGTCAVEEALTAVEDLLIGGGYSYSGTNGEKSALSMLLRVAKRKVIDGVRRDGRSVELGTHLSSLYAEEPVWDEARLRTVRDAVKSYETLLLQETNGSRWNRRFRNLVSDRLQGLSTKEALVEHGEFESLDEVTACHQNAADQRRRRDRERFIKSIETYRLEGELSVRNAEVLLGLLN